MKKNVFKTTTLYILLAALALCFAGTGCGTKTEATTSEDAAASVSILSSAEDIALTTEDGTNYRFSYGDLSFTAIFRNNTWQIRDSYRIENHEDLVLICQALSDAHPVPDKTYTGVRSAEDLAYEWEQHNLAFAVLPEGASWKENARHVDLNPEDQGKTLTDFLKERTGTP